MKRRIRVGDRVTIIAERRGGLVVRKDPVIHGKVVISHRFVVLEDGASDPRTVSRGEIERSA
jgi:hypothetical protein